jgi:hypothetical protein
MIIAEQSTRVSGQRGSSIPPSQLLTSKLAGLRSTIVRTSVMLGLSVAVLVGVEFLGLAMFLDWWLELPREVRAILLLAQLLVLGWLLARHVIRPLIRQPSDEELALAIEKARPQLRTRLIASVQLTAPRVLGPGVSAPLVEALVTETETIAAGIDFNAIVSSERPRTIVVAASCVLAIAVAVFVYGQPATVQLLKRAVLSNTPVPRKTRVEVVNGPQLVGRGDDVRIEAHASGIVPEVGALEVRAPGQSLQRYSMGRDKDRFAQTLENVQESFEYSVRLNDGRSDWLPVKVLPRPSVLQISCEQQFPAYTQLASAKPPAADLSLLAGSVLTVNVVPTREIVGASVKLLGLESNVVMQVVTPRELRGRFQVPAKGVNGFAIQLHDTEGMDSKNPAVYRVDIVPDKAPAVRITSPARREELFTRQAMVMIGLEATDDFQIARLRLRYKVDGVEDAAAKSIELDMESALLKKLKRRFEWKMSTLPATLGIGSKIEFWIEAEDNNDVTGPGIGSSERFFARLVTEEEKRADLWNRASDTLTGINDLASDQEKLNQSLGNLIREKAGGRIE